MSRYSKDELNFMGNIIPTNNPKYAQLQQDNFNLLQKYQTGIYGASLMSDLLGAGVNYNLLKSQNIDNQLLVQADQIELQALEEINATQEEFNNAISQLQYNAVMRGIKLDSGSLQNNIELSAKNLGTDVSKIKSNAKSQANLLKQQQEVNNRTAKINNKMAKAQFWSSVSNSLIGASAQFAGLGIQQEMHTEQLNKLAEVKQAVKIK